MGKQQQQPKSSPPPSPSISSSSSSSSSPILGRLRASGYLLFAVAIVSSLPFLYLSHQSRPCNNPAAPYTTSTSQKQAIKSPVPWSGNLSSLPFAWNRLRFSPAPPPKRLNIALFVKKWPRGDRAGGMERHALTLHLALARRGHSTHVFSAGGALQPDELTEEPNMHYHFSAPTATGNFNQSKAWEQFLAVNATRPFDVVHSESVGLSHGRARGVPNVAVSWHGIAYEVVHSEIAQDLARPPGEPRPAGLEKSMAQRVFKVIEEVKFFDDYAHHVATSDHVGDILRRIYMIPEDRVHVILNGVDEGTFKRDVKRGMDFRRKHRVPDSATLVLGVSGRLVADKGHPIMVEALKQIYNESSKSMRNVFFLVAGDGPWGKRYKELGPNFKVLGPLDRPTLSGFYNALDVFVHPTLRAQGLDQTVLEAMISGKPAMVARFAGITESAVVSSEMGYVFSPRVARLKEMLYRVIRDGRKVLEKKGEKARQRALQLFTADKMVAAYERLFLCMSTAAGDQEGVDYCKYPFPSD